MITLTLILCFDPLYAKNPEEFCALRNVRDQGPETIQTYCRAQRSGNPMYGLTVCREFDGSDHDINLLKY